MKLTAFKYGVTEITERMAFGDGNENIKLPIALLFFLIEIEDKKILVDVGCDTMPGFDLKEFKPPAEVLESYGIKRDEITDIIITHSHHDHIDAIRHYCNANIYLHKNELHGANPYLTETSRVIVIEGDKIIFKNIQFKFVGGHSPGSGIVLIKGNDKTYTLCGDECYTKENLSLGKPTGSSFNLKNSENFVNEYRKDLYIPILFHDPELVPEIGYKTIFARKD